MLKGRLVVALLLRWSEDPAKIAAITHADASKLQSTGSNSKQGAQVGDAGWWHGSNFRVTYIYFSSSLHFRLTTFEIALNCCLNISGVSGTLCFSHSDFRTPHRNIGMTGFTEIPGIPISVPNYFRFPDLIAECRKPEMPTKPTRTSPKWSMASSTFGVPNMPSGQDTSCPPARARDSRILKQTSRSHHHHRKWHHTLDSPGSCLPLTLTANDGSSQGVPYHLGWWQFLTSSRNGVGSCLPWPYWFQFSVSHMNLQPTSQNCSAHLSSDWQDNGGKYSSPGTKWPAKTSAPGGQHGKSGKFWFTTMP